MNLTRREVLGAGGGFAAALWLPMRMAGAADVVDVVMQGRPDGSHVWFDPIGILIQPGQTVRWINRNAGNSHTSTAYHPDNFDRALRMPKAAKPWDSDYLLPDESFSVTFTEKGVYDYFCVPHEHAGMVGRIVVGEAGTQGWMQTADADADLPEVALKAFPTVAEILANGIVRRA